MAESTLDTFFSLEVSPVRVIVIVIAVVGAFAGYSRYRAYSAQAWDDSLASAEKERLAEATFAGGCFWCMEPPFEKMHGVREVVSGFAGGESRHPTYERVASGQTEHVEAVRVYYDPKVVSYRELLEVYWRQIDPTDDGGQFADRGHQYTTTIFYHDARQRRLAERSKERLDASPVFEEPIVTDVEPAERFAAAVDYHQNYYQKRPLRYAAYRYMSGRDAFLAEAWNGHGDVELLDEKEREGRVSAGETTRWAPEAFERPSTEALREQLSSREFAVTQRDETEPAFDNRYWDHDEPGIYVDVVSGEPLFSSTHKFDSGTGWPSFYRLLVEANVVTEPDVGWLGTRTEVRSRFADSHLGHVFDDGPPPTGKRYCINSAALEFVPAEELEAKGYGEFADMFESSGDTSARTNGTHEQNDG